jgi:hypothetical protein
MLQILQIHTNTTNISIPLPNISPYWYYLTLVLLVVFSVIFHVILVGKSGVSTLVTTYQQSY